MKKPEFMSGTNMFVIKLHDNSKIIVTREIIDGNKRYIVKTTQDISYALSDFAKECGYIIMLLGISIDDDIVTLEGTVVENIELRNEYHIVNGNEMGKFTEMHTACPEEEIGLSLLTLCFEEVKEMTGDIDVIEDMLDNKLLSVSNEYLIKHDIITKPRLSVINNKQKIKVAKNK